MKDIVVKKAGIVIFLFIAVSCGLTKKSTTSLATIPWQSKPIVIDGNNNDWELPYRYADSKAKITYTISNDKTNLYITMKTDDPMTQLKILNAGMQVWIDMSDKKEKKTGILFPMGNTEQVKMQRPDNSQTKIDMLKKAIDNARIYSLKGFVGCDGGYSVGQKNDCQIVTKIGISTKTNELVWEATIPYKSFHKETIDGKDVGRSIEIDFEINAMKRPSGHSDNEGGAMQGGGGMRGGGGGGRAGGMRGSNGAGAAEENSERIRLFETTNTWEKIKLSYQIIDLY
jgi:hypothetical protein